MKNSSQYYYNNHEYISMNSLNSVAAGNHGIEGTLEFKNRFRIAFNYRIADQHSDETLIFIHGFGSDKEFFKSALTHPSLLRYNLITFDLPGFGDSEAAGKFRYRIAEYSELVIDVLLTFNVKKFHICAHSMGGLIGIEVAKHLGSNVQSFSNLEGNLTIEDCFISEVIANQTFEGFKASGRQKFEIDLKERALTDPVFHSYRISFRKAGTGALYLSAKDTVKNSTGLIAFNNFIGLRNQCYIYGEKNRNIFPSELRLKEAGVPVFYIKNAGHAMAEENPLETFSIMADFIKSCQN